MIFDVVIIALCIMASFMAFIVGLLTAKDLRGVDEHRVYLKGYKKGFRDAQRRILQNARDERESN